MWQIGDGTDLRIFEDPCVVTKPEYRVHWTCTGGQTPDTKVQELIEPEREWDEDAI